MDHGLVILEEDVVGGDRGGRKGDVPVDDAGDIPELDVDAVVCDLTFMVADVKVEREVLASGDA